MDFLLVERRGQAGKEDGVNRLRGLEPGPVQRLGQEEVRWAEGRGWGHRFQQQKWVPAEHQPEV